MKILHKIKRTENEEGMQVSRKHDILSKLKGKMTKKRVTVMICGALAVVLVGGRVILASAAKPVDTVRVANGSMNKELELNGKIRSNTVLSIYSDVECKVGKIAHTAGEAVDKGVPVIEYDKEDLDYRLKTARLNLEAVDEDYKDRVQSNNKMVGLYSEATSTLDNLDIQIALYEAAIDKLDTDIENKSAALADEGAKLQISLIDWADEPDSDEYENLQKLVQTNTYEQSHNSELVEMKRTREEYSEALTECRQKKNEMTSQKSTSYTNMMTSAGKEKLENDKETKELSSARNVSNLESALKGVSTDFAGIITSIAVKEGSTVSVGQELYTIQSTEDMVVYFKVNKYDIGELAIGQSARIKVNNREYTGKVTKIEQAVTEDAKGVPGVGVEITPDDPDEGFLIGLDAKAYVLTLSEESVMQIPSMAVYSDADGEFVYVYKDGKAVKTAVSIGISNGEKIQILSGLKEGDEVILSEDGTTDISDGMEVKATKGQDEQ